jgi:hypothetical protein
VRVRNVDLEDRVTLEAWYVRNWTAWLDCIVFVKTFRTVLWPQTGLRGQDSAGLDSPTPEDSRRDVVSLAVTKKPTKSMHRSAGV